MTVTFVRPSLQERASTPLDPELKIITRLIQVTAEVGIQTDPSSIVNLYVALKSKPMAILTGIAQSGKVALVRILAQALIGDDPFRCQMMSGHAWWAGRTGDVALFTDMQTRLNSDKVLNLIEEARQPENVQRVYIACLTRISPAELIGFFSELASQLLCGQVMQLSSVLFTEPMPYPPNLLLIGTMDTPRWDWHDTNLLAKTTIIQWPPTEVRPTTGGSQTTTLLNHESEFLSSCIRDEWSARLKLLRILGKQVHSLRPVLQIADLLKMYDAPLPDSVIRETVVYLANAWSKQGVGLFDPAISRNVAIAADLAIAQTVLPYVGQTLRSLPALHDSLKQVLKPFPRSLAALENLN